MSEPLLTPGVPAAAAAAFEAGAIRFVAGWGDYRTKTCAHGALLSPCATPGDEIMWSVLVSARGLTTEWSDEHTAKEIIAELRKVDRDPTEAEMVQVFGPQWRAAREICRRWSVSSEDEKRDAWAAWAAWAAWDAWAARAARAAWDAWDAWAAWAEATAWDQAAFDSLTGAWVSVFGPIELAES